MSNQERPDSFLVRVTPRVAAIGVAVIVAILSLLTMSHTFGFIDSGEMAGAASTLGIPHPTGYPLLMILGRVAVLLLPGRDVLALNIFAALLLGAGAGVLTLLFNYLLKIVGRMKGDRAEEGGEEIGENGILYAAAGALLTSMTPIWWDQGTAFEAYALHSLMLPLVMLTFFRYIDSERGIGQGENRLRITRGGVLFSFVLGLSFTNHLTTILLAPALLFWFFYQFGLNKGAALRLVSLIPGFILGLLPYLYLPIRAAADPIMNWGRPTTFGRFIEHVSGAQFRHLMLDTSVLGKQLGWYFASLPGELAWLGLALALFGLILLFRRSASLALFSGLLFLTTILYAGTYAIKEIEPYFMTAMLALGFWAAVGLWGVAKRFGAVAGLSVAAVAVLLSAIMNWGTVNKSDDTMAEDLTRNLLETLPKDAVLFTTRWDILYSGSLYLQNVEKVRPDVTVINVNMLPDRVYLSQVLDHNVVFKKVSQRIRVFVNERKIFDMRPETRAARFGAYNTAFYRMVNGIIATCGRPVFVTPEVDPKVGQGWNRVPYQLALRVTPDSAYLPENRIDYHFSLPSRGVDPDVMSTALFYANARLERAGYELRRGDTAKSRACIAQAAAFNPGIKSDEVPIFPMGNRAYVLEGVKVFSSIDERK